MKSFVVSIYSFSLISIATLLLIILKDLPPNINNICMGVLTGSVTTLCLSIINYYNAKELLKRDLGLKLIAIYTILIYIDKYSHDYPINIHSSDEDIYNFIHIINISNKKLTNYSMIKELASYYLLSSPKFITYIHTTKDVRHFNSTWDVEENIINGFNTTARLLDILKIRLDKYKIQESIGQSDDTKTACYNEFFQCYFHLIDVLPQQIQFLDILLNHFVRKGPFHYSWTEYKKQYLDSI